MPAQCCDDLLNELQKFCYSFEPPGGWQLATKADDPTHWDGGAWCPPQAFETLAEDYSPKSCGEKEGPTLAARALSLFARVHPDLCQAALNQGCDGFCQNQCGAVSPPPGLLLSPPTPPSPPSPPPPPPSTPPPPPSRRLGWK